ncbi:MAG: EamA family transporter, partial [Deltaproteobacteria bacterium]|nr:EamA family transporter [Deltaproteobacteria bacterium]
MKPESCLEVRANRPSMAGRPLKAYAALAAAMIIVGSSVVVGKLVTVRFPVFLASGLRFVVAGAVILPLLFWREKSLLHIKRQDWLTMFFQSLTGTVLFSIFLLY